MSNEQYAMALEMISKMIDKALSETTKKLKESGYGVERSGPFGTFWAVDELMPIREVTNYLDECTETLIGKQ